MPNLLQDLIVDEISLVDKAANKTVFIFKREGDDKGKFIVKDGYKFGTVRIPEASKDEDIFKLIKSEDGTLTLKIDDKAGGTDAENTDAENGDADQAKLQEEKEIAELKTEAIALIEQVNELRKNPDATFDELNAAEKALDELYNLLDEKNKEIKNESNT